ncbi:MAG: TCR/Tet family MFS transporter, partial [bacterium]|nr:TCR/Tet family MFS transporter [bacterium]
FTAGNQPIAQAALIDLSTSEAERTRYLGLVLTGLSLGLVVGPLMGGLLSDTAVLGPIASIELPFYAVSALVILNIVLITLFFHDKRNVHGPAKVRPIEVFLTLYEAARRPTILRLSLVFFFAQLVLNAYYVFMDNYFYDRFRFGTLENAIALVVLGAAMGLASAFLASPINQRFGKIKIISVCLVAMGLSTTAAIFNPSPLLAYVLIVPL